VDEAALKAEIEANLMLIIDELSKKVGTSQSNPHPYLQKLGKVQKRGFWVAHSLTDDDMTQRLNISKLLQEKQLLSQFLCDLLTGDEKWGFYSNVTKKKTMVSPRTKGHFNP
jgi:hypothetical protein